jgi:hypothetical protein
MVNSGVRGKKDRNLRTEPDCTPGVELYLLAILSYTV